MLSSFGKIALQKKTLSEKLTDKDSPRRNEETALSFEDTEILETRPFTKIFHLIEDNKRTNLKDILSAGKFLNYVKNSSLENELTTLPFSHKPSHCSSPLSL